MRARNIKPGIFKNELLGTADPILTILFAGLWTLADREGRLEDRPLRIKAEIFPYRDNLDVNGSLTELASLDFIQRYTVAEKQYIQIVNFRKHQTPHKTEKLSEIPSNVLEIITTSSEPSLPQTLPEPLPPDSSFPDSLNPDSPQCAREVGFFQKCFEYATSKFPELTSSNNSMIHAWEAAGYDFEKHVKPAIDAAKAKGAVPRSFNFFNGAIEDSAKTKLKPAPAKPEPIILTSQQIEANKAFKQKMGMYA